MNNFTVDKVSWHSETEGNPETKTAIDLRFVTLANFINQHELSTEPIIIPSLPLPNDFSISSSQLTEQGMEVLKNSYDKWLKYIDRGGNAQNTKILVEALP